jgi:ribonuclease BN (tRNA processing enzyme)
MELIILGSGTAVPSLRRGAPGYLLLAGGDRVVLEAGCGTMARLLKTGVRHDEVSHILCSHNHLDHTGELASWLFASRIAASARTAPLMIAGSAGFMAMLASLRALYGHWLDAPTYALTLVTLSAGGSGTGDGPGGPVVSMGGWSVQAFSVSHIESSLAYRITDDRGRVLAFTGDTDLCESVIEMARGADLLLIEASCPDGQKIEGHLTPSEAGQIARRAGVGRVVLTHFYPACDQADMLGQLRRTFEGEAVVAEDGMRLTV